MTISLTTNPERQFEALIDAIPQLAWLATPEGSVYWYNKRWYEYTGTTFEEMQGWGWQAVLDSSKVEQMAEAWRHSLANETPFDQLTPIRDADGHFRWFMSRTIPMRDQTGKILRWVGTATDVNETTMLQRQLRESLDGMSDSFFSLDKDWKIIEVNRILLERAHLKREDILGKDFRDVFLSGEGARESKYWTEYHRLMRDRVSVEFEEYYPPLDMWTAVRASPTAEGGMVVFSPDITERKRAELSMRAAKEEAERANELKSSFLANMSHEIRTPLGAMIGFAELLRDPGLSVKDREEYIDILLRNGRQLSVIIDDILDLSKVEAGRMTFEFVPLKPDLLGTEVVSLLRVKAQDKGIQLQYSSDTTTPCEAVSDPVRVRQVLMNLVNNAVKFTARGSVSLKSFGFAGPNGRRMVAFEITDTGIGIAEDQYDRLFGMFVQADGSMTRRFGGTGLGLSLSRKLARSLGGDVILKSSAPNRGSTFLFTFEDRPEMCERSEETRTEEVDLKLDPHPLAGKKVLIVDDSPDNRHLVSRYLLKAGATVATAGNGLEGSDKALAGDFDVVLMDLQMPEMDGYAATHRLRDLGYSRPIVGLTAHPLNEVREKALSAGCDDHLLKPINAKALVSTLAHYSRSTVH